MLNYASARTRYLDDTVATASPATLLVMMYDRLVRDLERAEFALTDGRRDLAHTELTHAQDIISELAATLDRDAWDGAEQLMGLYSFLGTALVDANVAGDVAEVAACRGLIEPLRDAWKQAAEQVAQQESQRTAGDLGAA
ncbi:flagellar export chaperone FliS [Demequina aestuarii]|uniref:flagellar export chaperone FliS n=1 Tax=Demequina aestuarii TaxID=327095 RepID=UPI000784E4B8|nr:flagellar export chaperone FliS [Demequina aestuarii]